MDPLEISKIVWKHRLLAIPLVLLVMLAGLYVLFFGPRVYQASSSFVLISPDTPSQEELDKNSSLSKLNSNNPYLRSPDPSLAVQVVSAKLEAVSTAEELKSLGLSEDYTAQRQANNTMMLTITASADSSSRALATRDWLASFMIVELRSMQKVYDADDLYLMTALPVDIQTDAIEKFSSRLRLLIVVMFGGAVLLFGAISLAEGRERQRELGRHVEPGDGPTSASGADLAAWEWFDDESHREVSAGNGSSSSSSSSPSSSAPDQRHRDVTT